jgi:hypothetical protein
MIWLFAHPLPPTGSKPRPATHRKTEKRDNLLTEEVSEGGVRGAESYDR